ERVQPRFAVSRERLRPAVGHPAAAASCHTALRDNPRAPVAAAGPQRPGHQALVVPEASSLWRVGLGGVEHAYTGPGSGSDGVERELLIRRQTHAAEADPQLGGVKPGHRTIEHPITHARVAVRKRGMLISRRRLTVRSPWARAARRETGLRRVQAR